MDSKLTKKTTLGVNWSFLKVFSRSFFSFFIEIVLARLIAPDAFGLLGLALIFIGFGNIFSSLGVTPAIIQKKNLTKENIRVGFTLSILSSLILYGIVWISAPFIASIFEQPSVVNIIRVLGTTFPLQSFSAVSRGILSREFKYKKLTVIEVVSHVFGYGLVAVSLALLGYGIWSLVIGVLVRNLFLSIALLITARVPLKPMIRGGEAKEILSFGGGISGIGIFNFLANQIDYFVIGKYQSAYLLGLYTKAFNLMRLPLGMLSSVFGSVLLASFSEIQDDNARIKRGYFKCIHLIALFAIPLFSSMFICADYIIVGLYGSQWATASTPFAVLCVAALFKLSINPSGGVVQAKGHVYSELVRQIIYATILVLGAWIGVIYYGLVGVSWAVVVASAIFSFLMAKLSLRLLNGSWFNFLKAYVGGLVITIPIILTQVVIISVLETFLKFIPSPIKLIVTFLFSVICYISAFLRIPKRFKGDGPEWIIQNYSQYLPFGLGTLFSRLLK